MSAPSEQPSQEEKGDRPARWRAFLPWIIAALCFAIFAPTFWFLSLERAEIFNTHAPEGNYKKHPIFESDQHVYLNLGRELKTSDYEHFIPRHRTPGFPLILAQLYQAEEDQAPEILEYKSRKISDAMFERGRRFSITLSLVLLAATFLLSARPLGVWTALIFTLGLGWLVFFYKAIYVQPELLFYLLFLACFVLLGKQILAPTWWRACLAGGLLALTFFIKSAVLPLIGLFGVCYGLKHGLAFLQEWLAWKKSRETPPRWGRFLQRIGQSVIVPVLFCALLFPYLKNTAEAYGSPFWSVHSKHLMWQEDAEKKLHWNRALVLPGSEIPEDAPSAKNWFANHSIAETLKRAADGVAAGKKRIRKEYRHAHKFLRSWVGVGCLLVALLSFRELRAFLRRHWIEALYALGFFLGYGFAFGFYQVIGVGPRMFLALYPPALFLGLWFLQHFAKPIHWKKKGWTIPVRAILLGLLALFLASAFYEIVLAGDEALAYQIEGGG